MELSSESLADEPLANDLHLVKPWRRGAVFGLALSLASPGGAPSASLGSSGWRTCGSSIRSPEAGYSLTRHPELRLLGDRGIWSRPGAWHDLTYVEDVNPYIDEATAFVRVSPETLKYLRSPA